MDDIRTAHRDLVQSLETALDLHAGLTEITGPAVTTPSHTSIYPVSGTEQHPRGDTE